MTGSPLRKPRTRPVHPTHLPAPRSSAIGRLTGCDTIAMKHKRNISWTAALVVPALVAFSPRANDVSFHPESSSTLTKTFQNTSDTTLDEMTMVQNGQEIDASMFGLEMSATTNYTVTVTDEYSSVADGVATKLIRTYDEIDLQSSVSSSNAMMGESNMEMTGTSELTGVRVQFSWDDDAGEYAVSFPEGEEGDEELLEGLDQNMDLAGLLPEGEVSVGDTWSIDPQGLRPTFAPGGAVKVDVEMPDAEEDMMGMGNQPTPDQFIGDFEGDVTGELVGMREEGGVNVAVIKLSIDVSSNKDVSEAAADMMGDAMEEQGIEMELESMDSEFSFEGEGELLWNVQAGVIYSLEFSGESSQVMDMAMTVNAQGQEMDFEQSMTLSGSYSVSVTTEQSS